MRKPVKTPKKEPSPSERLNSVGIEAICQSIASGMSLREWSRDNGFAVSTVHTWIDEDKARAEQYAHARDERAELIFDELDGHCNKAVMAESAVKVAGLRLKVDTLKWKLGKMNPKKYGDKLELAGDKESPLTVQIVRLSDADKPD